MQTCNSIFIFDSVYNIIILCFPGDDTEDMFLDVDDGVLNGKYFWLPDLSKIIVLTNFKTGFVI